MCCSEASPSRWMAGTRGRIDRRATCELLFVVKAPPAAHASLHMYPSGAGPRGGLVVEVRTCATNSVDPFL